MNRSVAVLNQKGGVGKTTVTLGLASALAAAGKRTLVVDLDPQASSTWVLGIDPDQVDVSAGDVLDAPTGRSATSALSEAVLVSRWSDLIDVVPARGDQQIHEDGDADRLRRALEAAGDAIGAYDVVLIDCPPSLGNLTTNALTAARFALIVVEPSALGLRGIGGVADLIDQVWDRDNPDLELAGVVLNRVPAVSNEAESRIAELARIVGRSAIWSPPVPQRVVLNQAVGERRPIHAFASRARDPIDAFDALATKLLKTIRSA